MNINIVFGKTGEYEDYTEWEVAAYSDEKEAKRHCEKLNEAVTGKTDRDRFTTPLDPYCRIEYTGIRYEIQTLPISETLEEFLKAK